MVVKTRASKPGASGLWSGEVGTVLDYISRFFRLLGQQPSEPQHLSSASQRFLTLCRAARGPTPFAGQQRKHSSLCRPEEKQANRRLPRRGHSVGCDSFIWSDSYVFWIRTREFTHKSLHGPWLWQSPLYLLLGFHTARRQNCEMFGFPHLIHCWDTPLATPADFRALLGGCRSQVSSTVE